jgi:hypothetical protein
MRVPGIPPELIVKIIIILFLPLFEPISGVFENITYLHTKPKK